MLRPLRFKALGAGRRFLASRWARLLAPLSWLWGFVVCARNAAYARGWLRTVRVAVPVVSVGNLTSGGSGKTPLVILLAQQFPGCRVAVLARGYGAVSGELSDEMRVIQRHVPSVRLYQGADRAQLAQRAVREGAELIILDDGFQHRRLHRDWDLVVVRPADAHDRLLPSGSLREPLSALERADLVFAYEPTPLAAVRLAAVPQAPPQLRGERVALFSGIGNPERFRQTVETLGAVVVGELQLADHEPASAEALQRLLQSSQAKTLVCTEKDFVKLPPGAPPVVCLCIEAQVVEGQSVWQKLVAEIHERLDNPRTL